MTKLNNIDSKGYGKIYKAVTRNPALPLIAKAIYAYLCSYAGNGTTAFPSRNQITNDLRINKDTFTTHMNTLVEQGFIARQRTTTNNLYTIVQQIAKESNNTIENNDTDFLVFDDIKSKGYGTIPKLATRDKRLTAQSKGIYAYFCSFAGSGNTAFPRQATILRELNISKNTYYKHYRALLEHGYLSVTQQKLDGKFTVAVYRIHDSIEVWGNYAMSEKVGTGKKPTNKANTPEMSEKLLHGSATVENSKNRLLKTSPMSEKLVSEKLVSEEVISEKLGYPNIGRTNNNNIPYKKHSYNKQGSNNHNHEDVENIPTIAEIEKWIGYRQHTLDMEASMGIRVLLGRSDGDIDDERYLSKYRQIVGALPQCLLKQIETRAKGNCFDILLLQKILCYKEIRDLVDRIMDNYQAIAAPGKYLEAAIGNWLQDLFCK